MFYWRYLFVSYIIHTAPYSKYALTLAPPAIKLCTYNGLLCACASLPNFLSRGSRLWLTHKPSVLCDGIFASQVRLPIYLFRSRLPTKVLCSYFSCSYVSMHTNIRTHVSRDCPTPTADAPSHETSCQEARQLVRTYLSPNERPMNLGRLLWKNRCHRERNSVTVATTHLAGVTQRSYNLTLLSRGYYHCHVASGAVCPDPVHLVWRCLSLVAHCELPNRLTDWLTEK
jgi:hypothetical protein